VEHHVLQSKVNFLALLFNVGVVAAHVQNGPLNSRKRIPLVERMV
jgi:hypothetical protein